MVVALSYIFAVIITAALAIVLYPIAAIFWIMGIFGRLAEGMFAFTQSAIQSLWKDLGNVKRTAPVVNEVRTEALGGKQNLCCKQPESVLSQQMEITPG